MIFIFLLCTDVVLGSLTLQCRLDEDQCLVLRSMLEIGESFNFFHISSKKTTDRNASCGENVFTKLNTTETRLNVFYDSRWMFGAVPTYQITLKTTENEVFVFDLTYSWTICGRKLRNTTQKNMFVETSFATLPFTKGYFDRERTVSTSNFSVFHVEKLPDGNLNVILLRMVQTVKFRITVFAFFVGILFGIKIWLSYKIEMISKVKLERQRTAFVPNNNNIV